VCAIIAKNTGLSDFEINYKADALKQTHATAWRVNFQTFCNQSKSVVVTPFDLIGSYA